jgi:hypothetical protein
MPLPTVTDAKGYLRVDLPNEDPLFTILLARAKAGIETLLGYAMTAVALTHVDYDRRYPSNELQLPGPFLATGPAPVVTDVNGTVVDPTTYSLDFRQGKIRSKYGGPIFSIGPYSVLATIGLSAHPDYDARLETVASSAILDFVAHLYENRNPMIGDDLGQGINSATPAVPPRIISDLMVLPCTRGLLVV